MGLGMVICWKVVVVIQIVISSGALRLPQLVNGKAAGSSSSVSLLLDFKKSSVEKDPLGVLAEWKPQSSSRLCSWRGITCSAQGEVVIVDLSHSGLVGSLHLRHLTALPAIRRLSLNGNSFSTGNLSAPSCSSTLERLDLSSNALANAIGADLSSCTTLSNLNLSRNSIVNVISVSAAAEGSVMIPPSVQQLDISHNHISDWNTLSSAISAACKDNGTLVLLNVSSNNLAGDLDTLSSCNALATLDLSNNAFQGSVQPDFPASLEYLDLSHNNFTALSFGSTTCGNLTTLMLSRAFLPLSVSQSPLTLSSTCRLLQTLDLSHNQLLSAPHVVFFNLHLKRLSLAYNNLSSQIPPQLAQQLCPTLQELDLSYNNFSGGLPPGFASCSSLITLNLANNQLSGNFLSTVVPKMQSLRYLYMAFNNITGSVPLSMSNCTRLQVVDLSSNSLTGNIPSGFCSASSTLEKIMMASNYLSGSVLTELGKCTRLKTIDLSFNTLSGPIPKEIWRLSNLSDLIIWANNLNGEIPQGICTGGAGNLRMLIMNNNLIGGSIPESISNCTNMVWLSMSNNRLTGHIPSGISKLASLAALQLGNNLLSGNIPAELGHCRSLAWLELNNNNLSGKIPMELADQSGLVMPSIVMSGMKYGFLRYQGGAGCKGGGGLIEIEGIRNERLYTLATVESCSFTRIYTGRAVYAYASNGTMIYLGLSYNALSGNIPDKLGSMTYLQMLNLAHNNLTGIIPNTFGGLISMSILDLSRNRLEGSIPRSMSMLTSLIELNMSNNNLSGSIPSGGQLITFSASSYANNSFLCGVPLPPCKSFSSQTGSESGEEGRKWSIAVGIAMGAAFSLVCIMAMIMVMFWMIKKKQRAKEIESLPPSFDDWKLSSSGDPLSINLAAFAMPLRKLTFGHLVEATGGFCKESMIGSGGFGDVYKAQLNDGSMVAVKKLIKVTGQGDREFMAEMETIGKIKHRNLVPLLGYCKFGDERILVYEYMKWNSLDSILHNPNNGGNWPHLGWEARRNIAVGSARGLAFLHHSCIPHIIHRDMKSSNVLLDEHLEARLSDFGMARLVNAVDTHFSVSTLAGTPGYVPPEYYQSFRCTAKGDVYSYGVVLLELLSGHKPIDPLKFGDDTNLVGWAKQLHREGRTMEILDPILETDHHTEISHFLGIAFECLDERPMRRPTMIQVMTKFKNKMASAAVDGDYSSNYSNSNSNSHSNSTTSDVMDGFSISLL